MVQPFAKTVTCKMSTVDACLERFALLVLPISVSFFTIMIEVCGSFRVEPDATVGLPLVEL